MEPDFYLKLGAYTLKGVSLRAQRTLYTNDTCNNCSKLKNELLEGVYFLLRRKTLRLDKRGPRNDVQGNPKRKSNPSAEIGGSFFPNPSLAQITEALPDGVLKFESTAPEKNSVKKLNFVLESPSRIFHQCVRQSPQVKRGFDRGLVVFFPTGVFVQKLPVRRVQPGEPKP